MDNLEKALKSLSKIEPENGFIKASKQRLMHQVKLDKQVSWLNSIFSGSKKVAPSTSFVSQAKLRLMNRITAIPQPVKVPLYRLFYSLNFIKKATASTLVMLIAVTSTLFVVEGSTIVEASDDSYLEVLYGTVSIKRPDLIVWETVRGQIELQAGDLIRVKNGSQAIAHFFDESQLRINEDSTVLISQLATSPAFGRQGIIEVSLHEGQAWVQTMNVEDGYAGFVVSTRNMVVKALNATFDVSASLNEPAKLAVYTGKVELSTLNPETREVLSSSKIGAEKLVSIYNPNKQHPITSEVDLDEQAKATAWVQGNLLRDSEHLKNLRARGYERLSLMAGTLPGDALYPIKQAKERLKLAWSNSDGEEAVKIEIANNRLNEAIILLEKGEVDKGQEALMAYKAAAREIIEAKQSANLASKLITLHQKNLTAQLVSTSGTGLVKETLSETAEILAENPLELERVRLRNSVTRLQDIMALIESGDMEGGKKRLIDHTLSKSDVLVELEGLEDEEVKREVLEELLELRQEEQSLLETISELLAQFGQQDETLVSMVASAALEAEKNLEETLLVATPLLPSLAQEPKEVVLTREEIKLAELVTKIQIYKSFTGQKNQIHHLLKNELKNPSSIPYLITVRNKLSGRAQTYLNLRILQLKNLEAVHKKKAAERKLERDKRLLEKEVLGEV